MNKFKSEMSDSYTNIMHTPNMDCMLPSQKSTNSKFKDNIATLSSVKKLYLPVTKTSDDSQDKLRRGLDEMMKNSARLKTSL